MRAHSDHDTYPESGYGYDDKYRDAPNGYGYDDKYRDAPTGYGYDDKSRDAPTGYAYDDKYQDGDSGHGYQESGYGYEDPYQDGNASYGYDDEYDVLYDGFHDGADRRSRTGLWVALSLMVGIVAGTGGTLFATSFLDARAATSSAEVATNGSVAVASGGDDSVDVGGAVEAADSADAIDSTPVGGTVPGAPPVAESDEGVTVPGGPGTSDPAADVVGCTIDSSGTPFVEAVNNSSTLSDYLLVVALLDGAGATLSEQPGDIYALRPGEHTVEELILDEPGGVGCKVVNSIRQSVEITAEAATDITPCEIAGSNSASEVGATVSVTNSDSAPRDFFVDLAIVDTAGIRRGTGFVELTNLAAGATVSAEVDTVVQYVPGLVCQVVGVLRTAS